MKKIVKLTESDLTRIVKKVIMEQTPSKEDILTIQKALNKVWTNVKIKEDGIMGNETIKYIKLFQKQNGLSETGKVSDELKDKLLPLLNPEPQGEDSKSFLIRILRNHLNSMEKDKGFDANGVAEVMINDSNNFLNKKGIFNK
jgi:peptidoglycan hydrolase-like protein with peptidoglycan-binding domain